MKIGIFTEVYKPIINGVVNSIIELKQGLEDMGHEVYIFCPTYKKHTDDPKDKNIVHLKSTPLPGKSGYHFVWPCAAVAGERRRVARSCTCTSGAGS